MPRRQCRATATEVPGWSRRSPKGPKPEHRDCGHRKAKNTPKTSVLEKEFAAFPIAWQESAQTRAFSNGTQSRYCKCRLPRRLRRHLSRVRRGQLRRKSNSEASDKETVRAKTQDIECTGFISGHMELGYPGCPRLRPIKTSNQHLKSRKLKRTVAG
jgi:hypothetical protein